MLIGLAAVWLLAANGRIAGVSGILHGLFAEPPGDRPWRALFVLGLILAGFAWHAFAGPAPVREGFGPGWAAAAGLLVGFGPALTALSSLSAEVFVFVAAMVAGRVC